MLLKVYVKLNVSAIYENSQFQNTYVCASVPVCFGTCVPRYLCASNIRIGAISCVSFIFISTALRDAAASLSRLQKYISINNRHSKAIRGRCQH
jgi:hypothetical protein